MKCADCGQQYYALDMFRIHAPTARAVDFPNRGRFMLCEACWDKLVSWAANTNLRRDS